MSTAVIISIAVFFILQQVMVILSTMRTILTVTASPTVAMIVNTISYTLYAGIVKLIGGQEMITVLIVTAVTNIIGVYVAKYIVKRMTKDKMWVINATLNTTKHNVESVVKILEDNEIPYLKNLLTGEKYCCLQMFAETQKESSIIINTLDAYDIKHYAVETK